MADEEDFGIVFGTGKVFRDTGVPNADLEHLKSRLAAKIIGVLEADGLTVRSAEERTGIAAADFSRVRRAKLDRFTVDRLMIILERLGQRVDIEVTVRPEAEAIKDDEAAKASAERKFAQRQSGKNAA